MSESAENRGETADLYSVYSLVFSALLNTFSASQPYCRKGFGFCIQCIQRIPTPSFFAFSLLLGREYMNTVNTRRPEGTRHDGRMRGICIQRPS